MRAIVYDGFGVPPRLADVPAPECPVDGAVVEVAATGICRSDWHAWRGSDPVSLPHIPGHEFAGVVAAVGPDVADVRRRRPGDGPVRQRLRPLRVVPHRPGPGLSRPDPARLHPPRVVRRAGRRSGPPTSTWCACPVDIDFISAAALGCRFATAFRAVTAHGRVTRRRPGGGLRLRRRRPVRDHGRGRSRRRGLRRGPVTRGPRAGRRRSAHHMPVGTALRTCTCRSTRSARPPPPRRPCGRCAGGGRHVQVGLMLGAAARTRRRGTWWSPASCEIYGSHGMAAADYPDDARHGRRRPPATRACWSAT